jgi:septal ring-binding cell division protein DamX
MYTIDPKWRFLISIFVTLAIGVSQGTVVLSNAIPDLWIKPVVAWCGLIAFVGSAAITTLNGMATTTASRATSAANDPAVDRVIMKDPALAKAIPSNKVVDR